jgi:HEAT repeat protein
MLGALLLYGSMLCGCFLQPGLPTQPISPTPDAHDSSQAAIPAQKPASAAAARGLMRESGWYRRPFTTEESASGVYHDTLATLEKAGSGTVNFRYRHAGLEQFLARPAVEQTSLAELISDSDHRVAATAAIGLARKGDPQAAARLIDSIEDEDLPLTTRCAAVEALGQLPGDGRRAALSGLLDRYGRFTPSAAAGYQSDLHAELLAALARHVDAADDRRFIAAAAVPWAAVRIETLRAWSVSRRGLLPGEISDLRSDDDPRVRAMAMQALAAQKPAEALEDLKAGLHDVDLSVRLASIRGLGCLEGEQVQVILTDVLQDRAELIRAEAVAALAARGSRAAALAAASDKSWRVRLKVARALAAYGDSDGASVARRLLDDPSAEVSRQVVRSLAAWPWEFAAPVLLEALSKDTITVRKAAAEELAARWPSSGRFPFEGTPARRVEALRQLQAKYQHEYGASQAGMPDLHAGRAGKPDLETDLQVEKLLNAGDMQGLAAIGPPVVDAVERLAIEQGRTLPEAVYRDVLPLDPVFATLYRLQSDQTDQRRRAGDELAVAASKRPLGRLAVARLSELIAAETDANVWTGALTAIRDCGLEPAVRLARSALGQPSAEVRRQACEYLAAHPDPAHEVFLAPLLGDSDQAVVAAAIRALGAAGQIHDIGLLKQKLASPQEDVQFEAAVALVRLRDRSGEDALERLSYSDDLMIRTRVAQALGALGNSRLTGVLIRLLDDRKATVSHAALASLPSAVGRDVGRSDDGATASTPEQMARWKKWYAGQAFQPDSPAASPDRAKNQAGKPDRQGRIE